MAVLAFQCRKGWRQPWSRLAFGAGGLALGMLLVLGPYLIAVGSTTPGAALARVLGRATAQERPSAELPADSPVWQFDDGGAMVFPVKEPDRSIRRRGYLAATLQFGNELARVFGYGVGVLAVVGLWQLRRAAARPADRFVQVFFVLYSVAVIVFTSAEGYLSSRHLVLLVVPGVGCAGVGAIALGRLLAGATAGFPAVPGHGQGRVRTHHALHPSGRAARRLAPDGPGRSAGRRAVFGRWRWTRCTLPGQDIERRANGWRQSPSRPEQCSIRWAGPRCIPAVRRISTTRRRRPSATHDWPTSSPGKKSFAARAIVPGRCDICWKRRANRWRRSRRNPTTASRRRPLWSTDGIRSVSVGWRHGERGTVPFSRRQHESAA